MSVIFIAGGAVWMAVLAAVVGGALAGATNGVLIGYLRLRAFLTTIVMFLILRAVYDILIVRFAARIQMSDIDNPAFNYVGDGTVLGTPVSFASRSCSRCSAMSS